MIGGTILLYHRVIELPTDPQLLCVSRANFAEHLRTLKRVAAPMSLAVMLELAAAGRLPERAVAITFDDGYWDNLRHALPLLRAANVPATIFATSGLTDTQREFFWDDLERIFLRPNTLPQKLIVAVGRERYAIDLQSTATYSPDAFAQDCHWDVTMPTAPSPRQKVYRELCGLLHRATVADRAAAMAALHDWSGLGSAGRESHRMMTAPELAEAEADPLLEFGGHTIAHPRLSNESPVAQQLEIGSGRRGFSYPFGTRHDYTRETVDLLKTAGYAYACSNFNGQVTRETDPFQLPRFLVRNWDGLAFEQQLEAFFAWQPRTGRIDNRSRENA
ncbi:MAG TPA: polysaccharide deacetylase family protein [Tepidisphaeraceae bacterium]|jgi:peptidoglycan/xylan/chitin deacetylase (PgdA/CDA1 family)|nr:polysaccharide deacetylase family protein [Tepidisphaeraceae bacterium]